MRIYLAGPINACSDAECKDWRSEARTLLPDHEIVDPMTRDYRGCELEPGIVNEIVENDKRDILSCEGMLVYFSKPSVGTSMEILFAWQRGIPVYVANVSGSPPSPWLVYHSTLITNSLRSAARAVR